MKALLIPCIKSWRWVRSSSSIFLIVSFWLPTAAVRSRIFCICFVLVKSSRLLVDLRLRVLDRRFSEFRLTGFSFGSTKVTDLVETGDFSSSEDELSLPLDCCLVGEERFIDRIVSSLICRPRVNFLPNVGRAS